MARRCLSIILAAGEGTRMRSSKSKVLHKVAGLEMIRHVVRAARAAGSDDVALVVGRDGTSVADAARREIASVAAQHIYGLLLFGVRLIL